MNIGISGYPEIFPRNKFEVNLILGNLKIQVELMIGYIRSRVRSKIGTPENFVFLGIFKLMKEIISQ